ncbi:hypothetical protein GLA29479_3666 [Lysobacter antibioticus]|nr:hypothetical protein GLA29479_3666 [Lysobacter antibioticus]
MKNGAHPCAPPCGSSVTFASARRRTANANAEAEAEAEAEGSNRDQSTAPSSSVGAA